MARLTSSFSRGSLQPCLARKCAKRGSIQPAGRHERPLSFGLLLNDKPDSMLQLFSHHGMRERAACSAPPGRGLDDTTEWAAATGDAAAPEAGRAQLDSHVKLGSAA